MSTWRLCLALGYALLRHRPPLVTAWRLGYAFRRPDDCLPYSLAYVTGRDLMSLPVSRGAPDWKVWHAQYNASLRVARAGFEVEVRHGLPRQRERPWVGIVSAKGCDHAVVMRGDRCVLDPENGRREGDTPEDLWGHLKIKRVGRPGAAP